MELSDREFRDLLERYKKQTLSPEELLRFLDACANPSLEKRLGDQVERDLKDGVTAELAGSDTEEQIWAALHTDISEPTATNRAFKILREWWWAAAAIVVLLLGVTKYVAIIKSRHVTPVSQATVATKPGIAGGNIATLTLAGGQQIPLDNMGKGILTTQGNISITESENGRLVYNNHGPQTAGNPAFNKIVTPKGGQYCVVLSDGTKVWLNAASSLSYPVAFTGDKREVTMTGEAYFEVAKNPQKPFKVKMHQNTEISVLGTHFNVNTYSNEATLKTTLLEGSIVLKVDSAVKKLLPGQQARIDNSSNHIAIAEHVDLDQTIAWKNGLFVFQGATLEDLMRQVERWYNIDVKYQGNVSTDLFSGSFSRSAPLTDVLKILAYSRVHYKLEGDKLIVGG